MNISDPIVQMCVDEFNKRGEPALKTIMNCQVPKMLVLERYKTLPPIPEDQVGELKQYAIGMWPEYNEHEIEKAMKVVYTIGTIL